MRKDLRLKLHNLQIFSIDQLLKKISPGCYIINLDVSTGSGTHWVGIFSGNEQMYNIYFDPFGMPPDPRALKFIKSGKKPAIQIDIMSQDLNASSCGWHVLRFLKEMQNGRKPSEFLANIDANDQDQNEADLEKYFQRMKI